MMQMRVNRLFAAFLFIVCPAFAETGAAGFASMRRLVGEWQAKTPRGSIIRVSYRMIARDSVLVETFRAGSGPETLTVFHLDGPNVVATHYCAQGNQPRLHLDPASTESMLQFAFYDATNLTDAALSHLTRLRFQLIDAGHFDKTEIYTERGQDDVTVYRFARISPISNPAENDPVPERRR